MPFVSLGEALIDLTPAGGGSLKSAVHLAVQPGGAPYNVAIGLSRLGVSVRFAGALSSDAFGARLAELLRAEGVTHTPTEPHAAPTRLALIDHAQAVDAFRFYGDHPADTHLTGAAVEQALTSATGLYVSSLMLLDAQAGEVQRHAVGIARARDLPIFTDPNPRPPLWANPSMMRAAVIWLLSNAKLAKLSLDDAEALGWPTEATQLMQFARDRWPVQLVVTGGAQGCWASIDGEVVHQHGFPLELVDPTGAGDAFFAALIARYLAAGRLSAPDLRVASAAGALAAGRLGAVAGLPSLAEVAAFLDRH
jgi:fructokinase